MRKLFVLLIMVFIYTSCRKYEEDPYTVIFKSPEKRIEGVWIPNKILVNNIDSTELLKDFAGEWEFNMNNKYSAVTKMLWVNSVGGGIL